MPAQEPLTVEYLVSQGVSTFIEIEPGGVLSGLVRRINSDAVTMSIGGA